MNAADVMTTKVLTVGPQTPVDEIVTTLLRHGISAVPVVDDQGLILGLVSEGDLLRRVEMGTQKQPSAWRSFFTRTATLAGDYVRSHGKLAADIAMRQDAIPILNKRGNLCNAL